MARLFLLALLLALSGASHGRNLGVIGPTYPIAEPNLLDVITSSLREKEKSGELQRMQERATAKVTDTIMNPKPVPGLARAVTARTYYYDPTFRVDRNITDDKGQILIPAGTTKNPLDVITLSKHLLFFDARDAQQVAKAEELTAYYDGKVKPILVAGSHVALSKAWGRTVFYDQQGTLVKRFGITNVPAIVSQEGRRLRVDELVLP